MSRPDRKTEILDAALAVVGDRGLAGATHRAVDEAAGLPQGSTSYYFPRKTGLIEAAATRLADLIEDDCVETRRRFAELIADGKQADAIDFVAEDLLRYAEEFSDLVIAQVELSLAATRDPALAEAGRKLDAASRQPIEFFVKLLSGAPSPDQVDTCFGLLDGMLLQYVTGKGPKPTVDQIKSIFQSVAQKGVDA